jgi:hypothetical protein
MSGRRLSRCGRLRQATTADADDDVYTAVAEDCGSAGEVDVDEMTPREALNLLAELQRELKA